MLLSSPSLGVSPNPTLGSLLPYEPLDPLCATLRTSWNAPTLLSTGILSSHCATSTTTSFSHPKIHFYSNLVSSSSENPKRLWQTVNNPLHNKSSSPLLSSTSGISLADSFAFFFTDKISNFRLYLSSNPTTLSPHSPSSTTPPDFCCFTPASESEIIKILLKCPNKYSDSDPIPTWLHKECAFVLVLTITNIVKFSLTSSQFHPFLKESVISPLLKKYTLDKEKLFNYRPISNLYVIL